MRLPRLRAAGEGILLFICFYLPLPRRAQLPQPLGNPMFPIQLWALYNLSARSIPTRCFSSPLCRFSTTSLTNSTHYGHNTAERRARASREEPAPRPDTKPQQWPQLKPPRRRRLTAQSRSNSVALRFSVWSLPDQLDQTVCLAD